MGRAFETELSFLNDTYHYYSEQDTNVIEQYLAKIITLPLLVVGSGGSFSAAKAFEYFYQKAEFSPLSKAITPFELQNYRATIRESAVTLLTAGGNNPDTVNAFKMLAELEPKAFLTVCNRDKSKVHELVSQYSNIYLCDGALPSGKDGFLAVNSLFATIVLLTKAFISIVPNNEFFCFFVLIVQSISIMRTGYSNARTP